MQLEKRLQKQVVVEAIENKEIIGKKEVEDAVFIQMIKHGVRRISHTPSYS